MCLTDDFDNFIKRKDFLDKFKETFYKRMWEGRLIRWDLLSDNDAKELNDMFKKMKK